MKKISLIEQFFIEFLFREPQSESRKCFLRFIIVFTLFFSFFFVFLDEFRSKVACENEVIQLVCNPFSRIAIYSASYGRTEYESIQCTQPQGVKEESKYLHV